MSISSQYALLNVHMLAPLLVLKLLVNYYHVIAHVHRSLDLQRKVCTNLEHYARTPNDKSRKHLTNKKCLKVLVNKVSYLLHYMFSFYYIVAWLRC